MALGVVCYRKATNLKRAVVQKQHQDADPDRSDSTVYFQDMILCSEDSETDDGEISYQYLARLPAKKEINTETLLLSYKYA